MPKVSIIIPVYNSETTIDKCIQSAINQTLSDIEIICIDDCSSDNSLQKIEDYAQKDDRIIIIKLPKNMGAGRARNEALDIVQGEYVLFLDADDWIDTNACNELYEQIKSNNNDFVYFNIADYDDITKQETYSNNRLEPFEPIFDNPNIKLRELDFPFIRTTEVAYKIYSNQFLQMNNIRFAEQRFCEDDLFFIKAVRYADSVSVLNKYYYHYRRHSASACNNLQNAMDDCFKAKIDSLKFLEESNCPKLLDNFIPYLINSLFWWQTQFVSTNQKKIYYKELRKILIYLNKKYELKKYKRRINYRRLKRTIIVPSFIYNLFYFIL